MKKIKITMTMTADETYPATKKHRGEMHQNVFDLVRRIQTSLIESRLRCLVKGEDVDSAHMKALRKDELKAKELVDSLQVEVVED